MNLKDFVLLKEDGEHYEVKHPKGQSIKIAKKGLSGKSHEVIKKMAKGGMVKHYADGTPDAPVSSSEDVSQMGQPQQSSIQDTPEQIAAEAQAQAEQTQASNQRQKLVDYYSSQTAGSGLGGMSAEQKADDAMARIANMKANPESISNMEQSRLKNLESLSIAEAPKMKQPEQAAQAEEKPGEEEGEEDREPAGKEYDKQVPTIGGMPREIKPSSLQDELANDTKVYGDTVQKLKQNNDQLGILARTGGKINPNAVWENKSTPNKIGSALAIILGGIGSGLTKTPNAALQLLNDQINRDIDAQKSSFQNKMNVFRVNNEALGSEAAAEAMTRAQHLELAKSKVDEMMGNLPGPMAQQRAAALKQSLDLQIAQNHAMVAAYQTAMGNGAGQTGVGTEQAFQARANMMSMVNKDLYNDLQKKYIPGVGVAEKAPEKEQFQESIALRQFEAAVKRAIDFQTRISGRTGAWTPEHIAEAKQIAADLQLNGSELDNLKRFSEGEKTLRDDLIGKIGGLDITGSEAKNLNRLLSITHGKQQTLYNSLGVKPFAVSSKDQQALHYYYNNPNSPQSQAMAPVLKSKGLL